MNTEYLCITIAGEHSYTSTDHLQGGQDKSKSNREDENGFMESGEDHVVHYRTIVFGSLERWCDGTMTMKRCSIASPSLYRLFCTCAISKKMASDVNMHLAHLSKQRNIGSFFYSRNVNFPCLL